MGRVLDVIIYPDPRLKQASQAVSTVDASIQKHFDDLIDTVHSQEGVGLAGVQVGIMKRIFVVDLQYVAERDGKNLLDTIETINGVLCLADPEITYKSKETTSLRQGCLSLPGASVDVSRPKKIKIKFLDYNNKPHEIEAEGMFAQCLQHEYDHTIGKLITDYLSPMKRDMQLKKVSKYAKHNAGEL